MTIAHKIYDSNRNILQRFKKEKVDSEYLKREDVMHVFLGKPRISDSITVANGLITIHYSPTTYKIYGFTVPYVREFVNTFSRLLKDHERVERKPQNLAEPVANMGMSSLSAL